MLKSEQYNSPVYPTWCPGCGDFGIWRALKNALTELNYGPHKFLIVYGIGCSGNMCSFVYGYGFHGLHGRSIPVAIGARLANIGIPVIVCAGDGDLLAEGGNHFIHGARGNHNITVIIHNNEIYGLTKNQASPTTHPDYASESTPYGLIETPINPSALALTAGATFVAREFSGNIKQLTEVYKKAILHEGFAVVDTLQPCVTWRGKDHAFEWYRKRIKPLDSKIWPTQDRVKAIGLTLLDSQNDYRELPTGIFFDEKKPTYEQMVQKTMNIKLPLLSQPHERDITDLYHSFL